MSTRKLSSLALGLVLAGAAFAVEARGRIPNLDLSEAEAVPMVSTAAMDDTARVYCYNGVKGDPDYLYRGWICVPVASAGRR
jgi:hypothetical protein